MRLLFPEVEVTRSLPNIIKSNYVSVIEDNIKVIDSNLKDFQPMNFKKVHQLEGSEENSLDGLDNDEELFQINHELNGSDNLHHMQSMAERILEEAKLEAAKIKEDALASVASEIETGGNATRI